MFSYLFIFILLCCEATAVFSQTSDIPKPHKFVGYKIGADKKLFSWQTIYDYLKMLDEKSDRVILEELGQSTSGKPFVLLKISSPLNLKNIAKYRNLQRHAANPENLNEHDITQLTREKKVVVMAVFSSNIHGVASIQGVLEFVHRLITNQNRILDNVILLVVPDLNPDGMQKIVEWYNNYRDTPHEGSQLPGLLHQYAGDEIHEDWLGLNLVETQMVTQQLYNRWFPEIVVAINDADQLPRILIEAGTDTGYPGLRESLQNIPGLALNFNDETVAQQAFSQTATLHNNLFLKLSAAKTLYGTPLFYPPGSAATQKLPSYSGKSWSGDWWTMRDIIDSEYTVMFSLLDWISNHKAEIIRDFCLKNIALTKNEPKQDWAYHISAKQHDLSALNAMMDFLSQHGVKLYRLAKAERVVTVTDYIIPRAQPARQFIDFLFAESEGIVNLPERYGVEVATLKNAFDSELLDVKYIREEYPIGDISQKGDYLISNKSNDAYILINRLFSRKKDVFQFREEMKIGGSTFLPGTIYIPKDELDVDEFKSAIKDLIVDVQKINFDFQSQKVFHLQRPKIGLFHPWVPTPDQGWTRFVLDKFGFLHETLYPSKVHSGGLNDFDIIILPDMDKERLIYGWQNEPVSEFKPSMPRPYVNGITDEGVQNLKKYVMEGGTLVLLGESCRFAVNEFNLPVAEVSQNLSNNGPKERLIAINLDNTNPIAFGMQGRLDVVFTADFFLQPMAWHGKTDVVAHLANPVHASNGHSIFNGKEKLPAVLNIPMGEGQIVLMQIRSQFRAQTPATYKLLFNAILNANSEKVVL